MISREREGGREGRGGREGMGERASERAYVPTKARRHCPESEVPAPRPAACLPPPSQSFKTRNTGFLKMMSWNSLLKSTTGLASLLSLLLRNTCFQRSFQDSCTLKPGLMRLPHSPALSATSETPPHE
eukprot:3535572-Rhodomonas_salina.2